MSSDSLEGKEIIQASWVKEQEIDYINKIFDCRNLGVSNPTIYAYTGNNFFNNRNQLLLRPHPSITSVLKPIANTVISKNDFIDYLFESFTKYTNFRKIKWNLINTSNGSIGSDNWGYGYLYDKNILAQETNHILNNKRDAEYRFVIKTRETFLAKCSDPLRKALNDKINAITINDGSYSQVEYAKIANEVFYGNLTTIKQSDLVRKTQITDLLQAFINACAYITETYWVWFTEQDRSTAHWIKYHLTRELDATKSPIRWTDLSATPPPNDLLYNGSNYDLRHKEILQYWPISANSNEPDTHKPNSDYTLYMNVPGNFAGWNKEPEKSEAGTYNNGYTTFTLTENTRIYPYHNLELWPAYKTFMKITYKLANDGTYLDEHLNQNKDEFYDEVHLNGNQFDVKLRDSIPIGTTWTTRAYIGANNPNGTRFTPAVTWRLTRKSTQTDITTPGYVLGLKGWTTNPGSTHIEFQPGQVLTNIKNHLTLYPIIEIVVRKSSPPKMGTKTGSWGISRHSRSFANIVGSNVKREIEGTEGIVVGLYFSDSFKVPKSLKGRTHLDVYFAGHHVLSDAQDERYASKGRCSSSGDGTLCAHAKWNGQIIFNREEIRKGLENLGLDGNHVYTSASCDSINWSDSCHYDIGHDIEHDGASINRISYIKMTESFETTIVVG